MLTLPPSVRIYVALGTSDLRRSIDGLSALVRDQLGCDPFSGHLFLFRNRRRDRLKILVWDRSGFWVMYKRLERGTFAWPQGEDRAPVELGATELMMLLGGVDVSATRRRRWYQRFLLLSFKTLLIAAPVDHVHNRLVNVSARYPWWPVFRCPSVAGFGCPPRITVHST